jgi:transposase-like protein
MTTTKLSKRKVYKPEFKAKVALEAVKGRLTINQIAKEFEIHPVQVSTWKRQFLESLPQIFENPNRSKGGETEELINQLYQQIGKLKVELDWVKKKSDQFS